MIKVPYGCDNQNLANVKSVNDICNPFWNVTSRRTFTKI